MRSLPTLPPLHAVRAFEAAGRLLNFRRAAEELLITQSAVSHHIRQLEEALSVRLFVRHPRSVELTAEGARYLEAVSHAFDVLKSGTADVRGYARRVRLKVGLLPSFAANWLVPRLEGFNAEHPDIELELDPDLKLADLPGGEVDIAIRYGAGDWKGVETRLLISETLTPVASPALLARSAPLKKPADILRHTLLLNQRPNDWKLWSDAAGVDLSSARTMQLTDYNIVLQAALDGQGIALGRRLLVMDRLKAGSLVEPFAKSVTSPSASYWLVMRANAKPTRAMEAFADWITAEIQQQVR
jgi:LysR family transcriptional regulator, glycine cleavage system transcriptional activator